jgi:RNA polymerase sigma-70 factor (ECF subfamily)
LRLLRLRTTKIPAFVVLLKCWKSEVRKLLKLLKKRRCTQTTEPSPAWSELTTNARPPWLDKLHEADQEAWHEFVKLYQPLILHVCHRWRIQEADAADAAQNVFLQLSELLRVPRPDLTLRRMTRLILRMVQNQRINFWRQLRRVRGSRSTRAQAEGVLERVPAREEHAPWWQREELGDLLQRVFRGLRPRFQERNWRVLAMRVFERRPYREIAIELGFTNRVLLKRWARLQHAIRKELKERSGRTGRLAFLR